jgi:hypothetical protein
LSRFLKIVVNVKGFISGAAGRRLKEAREREEGEKGSCKRSSPVKLKRDFGEMDLERPRDRNGDVRAKIVEKRQRPFSGFDDLKDDTAVAVRIKGRPPFHRLRLQIHLCRLMWKNC